MTSKTELRQKLLALRDVMSAGEVAERSSQIRQRIASLPLFPAGASVFVYVSQANEVDTHELIQLWLGSGIRVAVPYIHDSGQIQARMIGCFSELVVGAFGILTAKAAPIYQGPIDVCIVPAVALSKTGARLGRGGGYYDRFLATDRVRVAIGLCFDRQFVEHLPVTELDRPVDIVVTDKRTVDVRG